MLAYLFHIVDEEQYIFHEILGAPLASVVQVTLAQNLV
jgi:hypothetical protein